MATYEVTDPTSGKTIELTGDSPPTEAELNQIFEAVNSGNQPSFTKGAVGGAEKSIGGFVGNLGRDISETAQGIYGMVRHPVDTLSTMRDYVIGAGGAVRSALGMQQNPYATEEERTRGAATFEPTRQAIEKSVQNPSGIVGRMIDYAYDKPLQTALLASQAGVGKMVRHAEIPGSQVVANAAKAVGKATGKVAKETLGTMTGAGPGFVEEAMKGTQGFQQAMRGKISGESIVENARDALDTIKQNRADAYRAKLEEITGASRGEMIPEGTMPPSLPEIDISPIAKKFQELASRYNVKGVIDPQTGELSIDTSRVAMGHKGIKDIENTWKTLKDWGSQPEDKTVLGLDTLKRQLDDFYSPSSQARGFVTELKKEVVKTINQAVPEYGEMTKGYAEASQLIKDIQSNLMLRKEGMTGHLTADNTLRRLTSALRENYEMRKDLLYALGTESGVDIAAQVAGYAGTQWLPRGGLAKLGAGGSAMYFHFFNPKMIPIIAASSPRIVGEFLNAFGKAAHSEIGQSAVSALTSPEAKNIGRMTAIAGGQTEAIKPQTDNTEGQ